MKTSLVSYGTIVKDFSFFARIRKELDKVKSGSLPQKRVDCYEITDVTIKREINLYFSEELIENISIEIFYPSTTYPSHIDSTPNTRNITTSYFIAMESGEFTINDICYPIVPFVLYSFDDSKPHNSNFCSIMIK